MQSPKKGDREARLFVTFRPSENIKNVVSVTNGYQFKLKAPVTAKCGKKVYDLLLMVELQKKYKIGVRHFGLINYVGLIALYYRECSRFVVVWAQTLLSPLVSSLLFLSVLTLALGNERGDVLGYSFITFLAPGLIIQSMILQSFSHSVSSLMISKMQGNIVDILYAPLSAFEVSFAIIIAAVTRSVVIGLSLIHI